MTPRRCCTSSPRDALARSESLRELTVTRPTLEDIYLELTTMPDAERESLGV